MSNCNVTVDGTGTLAFFGPRLDLKQTPTQRFAVNNVTFGGGIVVSTAPDQTILNLISGSPIVFKDNHE